jgi:hypothetical protein
MICFRQNIAIGVQVMAANDDATIDVATFEEATFDARDRTDESKNPSLSRGARRQHRPHRPSIGVIDSLRALSTDAKIRNRGMSHSTNRVEETINVLAIPRQTLPRRVFRNGPNLFATVPRKNLTIAGARREACSIWWSRAADRRRPAAARGRSR